MPIALKVPFLSYGHFPLLETIPLKACCEAKAKRSWKFKIFEKSYLFYVLIMKAHDLSTKNWFTVAVLPEMFSARLMPFRPLFPCVL